MKRSTVAPLTVAHMDELIAEITLDAKGDEEQLWAFRQAFDGNIPLPCDASVIGTLVQVLQFDYGGNARRGLTATCLCIDGAEYSVSAADVTISPNLPGSHYLAAYRRWLGLAPFPADSQSKRRSVRNIKSSLDVVILSVQQKALRCRSLGAGEIFTFRPDRLRGEVPGEIATIEVARQRLYRGDLRHSGTIISTRLDVSALGLVPLSLQPCGVWNPAGHYWGEENEPLENWARPIIARGPRPQFEMQQILPGLDPELDPELDPDDPDSDPIGQAVDLRASGDRSGSHKLLMRLCETDLRCLDAHAHLGNLCFDGRPRDAIRHYEAGFRIGELSLGEGFDGLLPWGYLDNRPFLRCMHGYGLCLWRLSKFAEATRIFNRMLWLNPNDNLGARFLLGDLRRKISWDQSQER